MSVEPWRRLSRRRLLDCRVFELYADRLRSPSGGREHEFFVLGSRDWVNVLPVTDQGEILLVRQYRAGIDALSLELPGGMVDAGEEPVDAARRELLEETGWAAQAVTPLGVIHPNPAIQTNRTFSFLAVGCTRAGAQKLDPSEEIEVVRVTPDRIDPMLRDGTITHALVAVAFLHWKLAGQPGLP